jgi:hypothetical protein
MRPLAILAALGMVLACQPQGQPAIYGPHVEGQTLAYEDPSLPQPRRSQERLQMRVSRTEVRPDGALAVHLDVTNLKGQMMLTILHRNGGLALLAPDGKPSAQLLPGGFPELAAWEERGTTFRVVGRATWEGAALLPDTAIPVGAWVESQAPGAPRRRTLYLPDLGEVEAQEERNGVWVTVNRLVAQGFTDLPAVSRP